MKEFLNLQKIFLFTIFIFFLNSPFFFGQIPVQHNIKTALVENLDSLGLKTGDMAFFQSTTFNGNMIQFGTLAPFTHSAMIVVTDNGDILLTHATNNDYDGYLIPVIGEKVSRSGVILTKLEDLFLSTDGGKTGFYKHIWIRKLKTTKIKRPIASTVLHLYSKYKNHPFESSNFNFILSAFDFRIRKKDLLKSPKDENFMCSEYISHLFFDLAFPINPKEAPRETTPVDIYNLLGDYYDPPIVFGFNGGLYHIIDTD